MAKLATLTDNFAIANTSKWSGYGSNPTVTSGQLHMDVTPSYPAIRGDLTTYDLTASYSLWELIQAPNPGNGSTELFMRINISGAGNDSLQFRILNNTLSAYRIVSGAGTTVASATYNASDHRWLRIRESSGTVYWDVSSNGTSWTQFASWVSTLTLTAVYPSFETGYWGTESDAGTVIIDNYNLAPPAATRFYLAGDSGTAASVTPAFGTQWASTTNAIRRKAATSKQNTTLTAETGTDYVETSTSAGNLLHRQYVSDPLISQTISGTVSMVISGLENDLNADASLQLVVRLVSGDGAVERGVLYGGHAAANNATPGALGQEFDTTNSTRIINAVAVTPLFAQHGDRLVFEIGHRYANTSSTSYYASLTVGDPTATSDFALTAGLATNLVPWIELSHELKFYTPVVRAYFQAADWLWSPIPANPTLDAQSDAIVATLSQATHICDMWEFGVTLRGPSGITGATPRYDIAFSQVPAWGADPFGSDTMPIPAGTPVPPGSDGHVAIADPVNNQTYNLWQAAYNSGADTWGASWGSLAALDGDGRELVGSSTGSGLARYGAVIRVSEIAAGIINHALFFSTDMAANSTNFRYPASRSDGTNIINTFTPIPEGARVQLNPSIDIEAIPNITPIEVAVAKALQVYGAYCGDNGGARMAFVFEYEGGTDPGATYVAAGAPWDYFDLSHIPWDQLRVLAAWNGEAPAIADRTKFLPFFM